MQCANKVYALNGLVSSIKESVTDHLVEVDSHSAQCMSPAHPLRLHVLQLRWMIADGDF
jgi:hypothetical protein